MQVLVDGNGPGRVGVADGVQDLPIRQHQVFGKPGFEGDHGLAAIGFRGEAVDLQRCEECVDFPPKNALEELEISRTDLGKNHDEHHIGGQEHQDGFAQGINSHDARYF